MYFASSACAVASFVFLAACTGQALVSADPTTLDFGTVVVGETSELSLSLTNAGHGATTVSFDVVGTGPFSVALEGALEIQPGESRTAFIDASPVAVGTTTDVLQVLSGTDILEVALRVTGQAGPVDLDGDGHSPGLDDCDDSNPDIWAGAPELCDGQDNDCDGEIDDDVDVDGDGDSSCVDCADDDAAIGPSAVEACDTLDNDCDDAVDEDFDLDGDGVSTCAADPDCDDEDVHVFPGAGELCNGLDEDCDGEIDEDWADADDDGERICTDCDDGEPTVHHGANELCDDQADNDCDGEEDEGCQVPDGDGDWVTVENGDCDDTNAAVFPNAAQVCDGILDNDCDGPDGNEADLDADGWDLCDTTPDCDDAVAEVHPGAIQVCDGIADNDCDGADGNEADLDADGWDLCDPAPDCDDAAATVHPTAPQLCDGLLDNDCDGPDSNEIDGDGDGVDPCDPMPDCDDNAAAVYPGATELCDSIADNNCDGPDLNEADGDSDGVDLCAVIADCDDADPDNFPGNPEICDGQDNDCDGSAESLADSDGDLVTTCAGDCDDGEAAVHPGASELCNGVDDNCEFGVDEGFVDLDGDGSAVCLDCDDGDELSYPGGVEICDGADNNCDLTDDEGFDADSDGVTACGPDGLNGSSDDDCDDGDEERAPGFAELCDGLDNDCLSGVPTDEEDIDQDGVCVCAGDCADSGLSGWAAEIHPGATEGCDGWDTDCSSGFSTADQADEIDDDQDGYLDCAALVSGAVPPVTILGAGDCVEVAAGVWSVEIHPGATEVCDSWDTDCTVFGDGGAAEEADEIDGDGDDFIGCQPLVVGSALSAGLIGGGDCDDEEPAAWPGAAAVCDGALDNNCDGFDDDNEVDGDADGETACDGDCNDLDSLVFSMAVEACSGEDLNCDSTPPEACASCSDALSEDPTRGTAVYSLDPDGPGGDPAFDGFCEMSVGGGGWTLVQRTTYVDPPGSSALRTTATSFWNTAYPSVGYTGPGVLRLPGGTWESLAPDADVMMVHRLRMDNGLACEPLYYVVNGSSLAGSEATSLLLTYPGSSSDPHRILNASPSPVTLSTIDVGAQATNCVTTYLAVPWFYASGCGVTLAGTGAYPNTSVTNRPIVRDSVLGAQGVDALGHVEADVCVGLPISRTPNASSPWYLDHTQEVYVR